MGDKIVTWQTGASVGAGFFKKDPKKSAAPPQFQLKCFPIEMTATIADDFEIAGASSKLYFRAAPEVTFELLGVKGAKDIKRGRAGGRIGLGILWADLSFRAGATFSGVAYVGVELAIWDVQRMIIPGLIFSYDKHLGKASQQDGKGHNFSVNLRWAIPWYIVFDK